MESFHICTVQLKCQSWRLFRVLRVNLKKSHRFLRVFFFFFFAELCQDYLLVQCEPIFHVLIQLLPGPSQFWNSFSHFAPSPPQISSSAPSAALPQAPPAWHTMSPNLPPAHTFGFAGWEIWIQEVNTCRKSDVWGCDITWRSAFVLHFDHRDCVSWILSNNFRSELLPHKRNKFSCSVQQVPTHICSSALLPADLQ